MPEEPSFEHEILEADIKALAAEVSRHREAPETKNLSEKELLKSAIQAIPSSSAASHAAVSSPRKDTSKKAGLLPSYLTDVSPEIRLEVEYLLDIAYHGGISKAVSEAKKSPDFIQDAFHDVLVSKLYPELKKRGIL